MQECNLDPFDALFDTRFGGEAGVIYLAPAVADMKAGRPISRDDSDRAAIVLMAGIAASPQSGRLAVAQRATRSSSRLAAAPCTLEEGLGTSGASWRP